MTGTVDADQLAKLGPITAAARWELLARLARLAHPLRGGRDAMRLAPVTSPRSTA